MRRSRIDEILATIDTTLAEYDGVPVDMERRLAEMRRVASHHDA